MNKIKVLPSFIIVGAQKCGTTTLYDILKMHPEVNMSRIKEINYFTSEDKMKKGLKHYSSYFKKPKVNHKITGEASPGYMNNLEIPEMIKNNIGEIKIVMILRDPIKRAFSQYWDNRRHLSEILNESEIVAKYLTDEYNSKSRGYFSRGVYSKYIEEYLKYFKRSNIHIMIFEELIDNPNKELKKLYNFLTIDDSDKFLNLNKFSNSSMIWDNRFYKFLLQNPKYNKYINKHFRRFFFFGKKCKYKYPLPSDINLKILQEFYKPWNLKLELLLEKKITDWNLSNPK